MFRKTQWMMAAGLLVFAPILPGQTPDDPDAAATTKTGDTSGTPRFWQATVPGGNFMVALDRITSVSRHRYLLDGAVVVDEVTVDTQGQALARFYFVSPPAEGSAAGSVAGITDRGREILEKGAARVSPDLQNMVVKKYPETTHSKSIEYRLMSKADLTALYSSVKTAWESGRGRVFTVKGS